MNNRFFLKCHSWIRQAIVEGMGKRSIFLIAIVALTLHPHTACAQEPLMAKGNKALTVSYGVSNAIRVHLKNVLEDEAVVTPGYTYQLNFTNPLQATFDIAFSDYTTAGVAVSWCHFRVRESGQFSNDASTLETKGYKLAVQLRGIRYVLQSQRSVIYFVGAAGIRLRGVRDNSTDPDKQATAYSHQVPELSALSYSPFSIEAGLGMKFLLTKKLGISAEAGMLTGIGQIGVFYSFKNKWRKSNDKYGW